MALTRTCNMIRLNLIGWRNMKAENGKNIKFDPEKLEDILLPGEAVELLNAAVSQESTPEPVAEEVVNSEPEAEEAKD